MTGRHFQPGTRVRYSPTETNLRTAPLVGRIGSVLRIGTDGLVEIVWDTPHSICRIRSANLTILSHPSTTHGIWSTP